MDLDETIYQMTLKIFSCLELLLDNCSSVCNRVIAPNL